MGGNAGALFGRRSEQQAVADLVAGPAPALLLLEGEAGIGKSVLWEQGLAAAAERGHLVLAARPALAEAGIAFAGLGDLLEPVADRMLAGLDEMPRAVLEVALLRRPPGPLPPGEREIGAAVLAGLGQLAAGGPVLLAVDDVQWLDAASARALAFALRRLRVEPVRVLLTRRTAGLDGLGDGAPTGAGDCAELFDSLAPWSPRRLPVAPLPDRDIARLIRDRLARDSRNGDGPTGGPPPHADRPHPGRLHAGHPHPGRLHAGHPHPGHPHPGRPQADRPSGELPGPGEPDRLLLRRLTDAARGNPYWAQELATALATRGGRPGGPAALPVPDSLAVLLYGRLARLPEPTRAALLVVAALARATWGRAARALTTLTADPEAALDAAALAGLLVESEGRLRPAHPLLGSAALGALPPGRRRHLHRRLAESAADPEERARHLALASDGEPDRPTAAALAAGAEAARARGATRTAAELAELAARHTPAGLEAATRLLAAAELRFACGELDRAAELATEIAARLPGAAAPGSAGEEVRARLLPLQVEAAYWVHGQPAAQQVLRRVLDQPGHPARVRAVALACAVDVGDGRHTARAELFGESARIFADLPRTDPGVVANALVCLADSHLDGGDGIDTAVLARAEAAETRRQHTRPRWLPVFSRVGAVRAYHLRSVDELAAARQALHAALEVARREGDDSSVPPLLGHLALTECWAGDYPAGLEHAAEALASLAGTGGVAPLVLYAARAQLAILTGDAGTARDLLDGQLGAEGPAPRSRRAMIYEHLLGQAALLDGAAEVALEHLHRAWTLATDLGVHEPGRRGRLEADLGQALVAAGELDRAAALAAGQLALGERHRRPTLTGVGRRIGGLVLAARGELDAAAVTLAAAAADHRRSPLPLELPRTLLALAQVHRRRRARPAAREALEEATTRFAGLGATPWLRAAHEEHRRLRSPRTGATLTAAEQRVADLAGAGHTNREIAAELFIGLRTVESHLAGIYRKLNIRGRAQLPRPAH